MWTDTAAGRELVKELAREVVAEVAPEELPLFEGLAQDYFDDPSPPAAAQESDEPLGFGLPDALVAVTPAAAAMAGAVLTYILTEVIRAFQVESAEALKKKIKKLFNPAADEPARLTTAQLEQVKKLAVKQARAFGVADDEARRMADALIGTLALAK